MKQTIAKNLKETVSKNLVKLRKQNKLKQRHVAERIFVGLKTYQAYEEKRAMPGPETLFALKEIYKLDSIERFYK